jgi:hypothetical protein
MYQQRSAIYHSLIFLFGAFIYRFSDISSMSSVLCSLLMYLPSSQLEVVRFSYNNIFFVNCCVLYIAVSDVVLM